MYQRGLGVEENEYQGFYWCRKAAEEGLLEAQFHLGLMYLQGVGVTEYIEEEQLFESSVQFDSDPNSQWISPKNDCEAVFHVPTACCSGEFGTSRLLEKGGLCYL